jgi:NADPH:quinone reductase-like Zn-dependent oxidoreductase
MGVQLALLRGATVIATAADKNHPALKALGAIPMAYGDGLVARVRALGKRIDAVFDAVGKGALPDSIELRGGTSRIVTIADPAASKYGVTFTGGPQPEASTVAALKTIAELASQKKVTVQISETLPLADAAKAHGDLEKKQQPGKVLLKP